jgi:hypothetical protein
MKTIITQSALEEARYFCDKHPDRECCSEIKSTSWYGSNFDMTGIEIHLCDECLGEFYSHCLTNYGIKPKDIII